MISKPSVTKQKFAGEENTCPLDVHKIPLFYPEFIRCKVIFYSWVDLYNIASLATNIQVVKSGFGINSVVVTGLQLEYMTTILEYTAILSCIDSQAQRRHLFHDIHIWILTDW